jgi:hypothetical protein
VVAHFEEQMWSTMNAEAGNTTTESLQTRPFVTHVKAIDTSIPSIVKTKARRYCPRVGSPFAFDVVNGLGHRLSVDSCDLGLTKLLVAPPYSLDIESLACHSETAPSHYPPPPHLSATMSSSTTPLPTITQFKAPTKYFFLLSTPN